MEAADRIYDEELNREAVVEQTEDGQWSVHLEWGGKPWSNAKTFKTEAAAREFARSIL